MRRTVLLAIVLALLLGARAVAQPTVSLRGNVGAAFFQSPDGLKTVLNSGVDLGIGAGVQVYEGLELVVGGSYDRFTFNGDNYALTPGNNISVRDEIKGGGLNVLNGTLGLRYTLQTQGDAHPYVSTGIGLYRTVLERARVSGISKTLSRFAATRKGYHVALGGTFNIDETYSFFFEPRYVIVDTANTDLSGNTSTRYLTIRLGLELRL
ncbi:MAG: outer membrane beta-barrel protein [Salinibacter sp.]